MKIKMIYLSNIVTASLWGAILLMPGLSQAQPKNTFESSALLFKNIPQTIPDSLQVVYYKGLPDGNGNITLGAGMSQHVSGFFNQLDASLPRLQTINNRLKSHINGYEETIVEEATSVLLNLNNDFKGSLEKFNTTTQKRVVKHLNDYQDAVVSVQQASKSHTAAKTDASAASYGLQAAGNESKECLLLLEKTKLNSDKEVLLAKIKRSSVFLNAAELALKTFATGGTLKAAQYVSGGAGDLMTDGLNSILLESYYSGTSKALAEIGEKIEAIDKSLADLACKKYSAQLTASKLNLESKMTNVIVTYGQIIEYRSKAWTIIDLLGEENGADGRKFPFFVQLKRYNGQANSWGKTVYDAINEYQIQLTKIPYEYGSNLTGLVNSDIKRVNSQKLDTTGNWSKVADGVIDYLGRYNKWHETELTKNQNALVHLREGKHLAFVDHMVAHSLKTLGMTVAYEHIIPN